MILNNWFFWSGDFVDFITLWNVNLTYVIYAKKTITISCVEKRNVVLIFYLRIFANIWTCEIDTGKQTLYEDMMQLMYHVILWKLTVIKLFICMVHVIVNYYLISLLFNSLIILKCIDTIKIFHKSNVMFSDLTYTTYLDKQYHFVF